MAIGHRGDSLAPLQVLFDTGSAAGLGDGELLARAIEREGPASESAFAALVQRHGPMVLRVCRKATGDLHDAQDAFQATFFVLAKKARSIRNRDSLASFLHGVALRVSASARASAARRRRHESRKAEIDRHSGRGNPLIAELQEEVGRLPRRYRDAVILCYLEGKSGEEAAALLDCPVGTIKSRLAWARDRLRDRLVKRGLATAVSAASAVASESCEAALPLPENSSAGTAAMAMKFARGSTGEVPVLVAGLARKAIVSMILSKAKWVVLAMAIGSATSGAILIAKAGGEAAPVQEEKDRIKPLANQPVDKADVRIREKLDKMVEIDLPANATLEDLVKALKAASRSPGDNGISYYVDPIGLQEAGCEMTTPIPNDIKKARLNKILGDSLATLKLAYRVKDGLVIITSRESNVEGRLEEIEKKLDWLIEAQKKAGR